MPLNVISLDLRSRRLPISPRKILLRLRNGTEFYLRAMHGVGIHRIAFCYHDLSLLPNLLLGEKRSFPLTRQRLSARKSSSAHSGSQGNKNTSSSSFWLFVLLVSHNDHRPNRYEQPCADVAEKSLLHLRPSYLHVVCYEPDSVWTNETSVSRGVQENRNV